MESQANITTTEQPETNLQVVSTPQSFMATTVIGQNSKALAEILMASIANVQKDAAYIPQATAIAEQVKEVINLAKVEVDMIKAVNTLNGK